MGPGDLTQVLAPLPATTDPRLLVGHETFDDAGVFRLAEDLALVQTVDFFAPIVDDPYTFGRVAATNALSDIYAMGGTPLTALNIVAFPTDQLPLAVLTEVLRGGQDAVHDAGAVIVGGHTVVDAELKYGLAVTGRVDPRVMFTNAAAQVGDRLVLTKPIGNGIIATAIKQGTLAGAAGAAAEREMVEYMVQLNRDAAAAALAVAVRCATDVTGFGLLGHASHIARASHVTVRIRAADVPVLSAARAALAQGARTGGAARNLAYLDPLVEWRDTSDEMRGLLTDPQTSGGLLVAVHPSRVTEYLSRVRGAVEIGQVEVAGSHAIVVA
jgi:selenide, water dikinase